MARDNLKKLIDPKSARGLRRRQILKSIFENPGLSQMEITKIVYGEENAANSYKSLRTHLKNFEDKGLIEIKNGKPRKVFLTGLGEDFCKREAVDAVSKEAKEFVKILNKWVLTSPLAPEEERRLYVILSDQLLMTLFAISDARPLPLPEVHGIDLEEKYFKLKPKIDVWRCLKGLWVYEAERLGLSPDISLVKTPIPVWLVEKGQLKRKADELIILFQGLLLKNPILAELRERVMEAWMGGV